MLKSMIWLSLFQTQLCILKIFRYVFKICTNWFVWECELRLYNYDTCTEIKTTLFRIWNIFRWISSIRKAELCLQSSPKPLNGYHSYVRQSCVCNPAQNYSMDIIKLNAMVKHKESSGYKKSISAINRYQRPPLFPWAWNFTLIA